MKQIRLVAGPLTLLFTRSLDRWTHQFLITSDGLISGADNKVLTSIEGDSEQFWPPSPPMQEIDLPQSNTASKVALGLGRAGQSHWSASFSLTSPSKGRHEALVEVACLSSLQSSSAAAAEIQLASRYDMNFEVETLRLQKASRALRRTTPGWEMEIVPLGGERSDSRFQIEGQQLLIQPTRISSEPRKPTQWGYRLVVTAPTGSDW